MKLLIFCPDSFSIFKPASAFIFGGIEVETGYYAKGLSSVHKVDVTVITKDQGEPESVVNGVKIVPHPHLKGEGYWAKRKTLVGRLKNRLMPHKSSETSETDLIKRINPDVIYVQGLHSEALRLCRLSVSMKMKFVFRVASDMDLGEEKNGELKMTWSGISYEEAVEVYTTASVVMVQTPLQQQLLKARFAREGKILLNPVDLTKFSSTDNTKKEYDILWVGKSSNVKRPEIFVEIAKRLPEFRFMMVFNKVNEELWNKVFNTLPSNVTCIESVPPDQINACFLKSKILMNTSSHEGFPNTYLQAAASGLPVVSMTQNPNEMLTLYKAGKLCGDSVEQVVTCIRTLLGNTATYKECSDAAKSYVYEFHDYQKVLARFHELIIR